MDTLFFIELNHRHSTDPMNCYLYHIQRFSVTIFTAKNHPNVDWLDNLSGRLNFLQSYLILDHWYSLIYFQLIAWLRSSPHTYLSKYSHVRFCCYNVFIETATFQIKVWCIFNHPTLRASNGPLDSVLSWQ